MKKKLLINTFKFTWKVRRGLFILFLLGFNFWGFNALVASASSPKANLTHPVVVTHPLSEHDQIKAYIKQVFGDQASNAFKVLACENRALNPKAQGKNKDGSLDTGIFQINSFWAKPAVLTNWKLNVDLAYQIYLRGGWNEWACESVWHALERKDTI